MEAMLTDADKVKMMEEPLPGFKWSREWDKEWYVFL
jgi:hypothetical protein